ncbi:MAG: flagellar biosynthetic protein FliO [Clostridia bacterium]|nr:flagellar biosynthetic protein FliO [Clostridia bacterium]
MEWNLIFALLRIFILLPIVLFFIYIFIRYGLGRIVNPMGQGYAMSVVDRLPVGPKSSLLVVRVAGKYYLIAQNEGSTTLLKELDSYPEISLGEGQVKYSSMESLLSSVKQRINDFRSRGEE